MRSPPTLSMIGAIVLASATAVIFLSRDRPEADLEAKPSIASAQPSHAAAKIEDTRAFSKDSRRLSAAPSNAASADDPGDDSWDEHLPRQASDFARVRAALAAAIATRLPDLKLSASQLDDLADATVRLRAAQAALREVPVTREHAERRALERERLVAAVEDFIYLVEMTPDEFSRKVEPGGGVDEWNPNEPIGPLHLRRIDGARATR